MMKVCTKCSVEQVIENFYPDKNRPSGFNPWCKSCVKICNAQKYFKFKDRYRQEQNDSYYPGKYRSSNLKRLYGITSEEFDLMVENQNGVCAICGENGDGQLMLNVDHDHETGQIRSLLCGNCNRGIGQFKENSKICFLAGEYLEKFGK